MDSNIISQTVNYKGESIKIESGKAYCWGFGTTIHNHSMHYSRIEIKPKKGSEVEAFLKKYGYKGGK